MQAIHVGDVVTIDPEHFYLENRGQRATVLEFREEVREPSGSVYFQYRLDLTDARKGDWYQEYQLVPKSDGAHDLVTFVRRLSQEVPNPCDYEAMKSRSTDDDEDFDGFDDGDG